MNTDFVISFGRHSLLVAAELAGPILLVALLVGLVFSIFQALTQIQESTLAFIPKIVAVIILLAILYPWFLGTAASFLQDVLTNFPSYINY